MANWLTFMGSSLHRVLVVAAVLCAGTSLLAAPAGAQVTAAPMLEILAVEHDASGSLVVGLRAGGDRSAQMQNLSVFVDDVPIALDLGQRNASKDLALMLVIDTSGSMAGAPINSAREAARALIDQLSTGDRVAVVSFANAPLWQVGLTGDHVTARSVLDNLVADGSTALYDAVALAGRELAGAPEQRRVVLLLSDGQDFGGVSSAGRTATIEEARSSGATFYTVGLGPEFDAEYLVELAEATGGEFYSMRDGADAAALTALFEDLGGRLGASETFTLAVSAMAQGDHLLEVRAVIDGERVSAAVTFEASNVGLLQPSVLPGASPEALIRVSFGSFAPSSGLTFEARAGEKRFDASPSGELSIDPWELPPGPQDLTLIAYAAGKVAARERITLDVPAFDPVISIHQDDAGLVARGRIQGGRNERATLVAYSSGVEVGRSETGHLSLAETGAPIRFDLLSADGAVITTQEFTPTAVVIAPSDSGSIVVPLWAFILVPIALAAAFLAWRRARPRPVSVADRVLRTTSKAAQAAVRPSQTAVPHLVAVDGEAVERRSKDEPLGMVMVVDAAGRRTAVPLTARPLTVGSSLACDIVLGDPVVRGQHLRLTALQRDEVQVHVLPERGARPHLRPGSADEEWLIAHHGEQIDIGSCSLQILPAGVAAATEVAG